MKNPLKAKLKAGKPSVGTWVSIMHPDVVEIVAMVGFDWMIFDTEHNSADVDTVKVLLQAASYNPDCIPLVRVAWNDMVMIKKALDIGAYGLIIPWVNTREEAENVVKYCKYPPEGVRGFGPRRAALRDPDYVQTANDELVIGIQIETQMALDNLDKMFQVNGIDLCLIGPMDLSMSLGIFGQFEHPKYKAAVEHVLSTSEKYGVVPGIVADPETVDGYIEQGFRFCPISADFGALIEGLKAAFDHVKSWEPTPYKG